jgi:hypothetical protein
LKGEVPLKMVEEIQPVIYKAKKKNCFAMVTAERTYYFCAETDELMTQWVNLLSRARDAVKGYTHTPSGGSAAAQSQVCKSPSTPSSPN